MGRINYLTKRNKPDDTFKMNRSISTYKLSDTEIKKLTQRYFTFNDWEKRFYNSLKTNNYKITSSKQWKVIKGLLCSRVS